jgi:hypothetical protein
MGSMKRALVPAGALLVAAGCHMWEPNAYNVYTFPHQWDLAGPGFDTEVHGPMPFEEVRDFVREKESQGWEVIGYELASLPEEVMVDATELDPPARRKRAPWRFDIPKTMDDGIDPPPAKVTVPVGQGASAMPPYPPTGDRVESIPPYLREDVRGHRQKYLVVLRRWH